MSLYQITEIIGLVGLTIVFIYAGIAARPPKLTEEDLK